MFPLMAFASPAFIREKADTAWVIIFAITAPITVVPADYLTKKQEEKKRRNDEEPQRNSSDTNPISGWSPRNHGMRPGSSVLLVGALLLSA